MAEHYFIDAYNVMHKSSLLRPVAHAYLERAREMLIDKAICFCMTGHKRVTIVFDGRNEEQTHLTEWVGGQVAGMNIIYSPHHTSADTVIERLIYNEPRRMDCIVVTNDGGLRALCRGMGALTMEADSFLASVRQFEQNARETVEKKNQHRATLLEDRLNATSAQALEALRSRLATDNGPSAAGNARNVRKR